MLTIFTESTAVIFMKLSSGFVNRLYAVVAIVSYVLSFVFLTLALKYWPAGIANAIWAGASVVLVATAGAIIFKEQLSMLQVIFLILIIIGIAGLNFSKAA